jgi:acyl-coenzyme A synthetase/AMP-(fatty) acid ligase
VGVVGAPDPYSQEVPVAFVVLSAKFAEAVKRDPKAGEAIKNSIAQVRMITLI